MENEIRKLQHEEVLITPDIAREMLTHNSDNPRKIVRDVVDRYVSSIKAGNWILNGEPIIFDEDGKLKSGQHRLYAVVKADMPICATVTRGVDRDATIFDIGRQRTIGELTNGDINNLMSGAVAILAKGLYSRGSYAKDVIRKYYYEHRDIWDEAYRYCRLGSKQAPLRKSACAAAIYCALRLNILRKDCLVDFCEIVNTGRPKDGYITDSAFVLRNTLNDGFRSKTGKLLPSGGGASKRMTFEVTWQALLSFAQGAKPKRNFKPNGKGDDVLLKVWMVDEV